MLMSGGDVSGVLLLLDHDDNVCSNGRYGLNFVWRESSFEINCSDCSFVFIRHDGGN